MKQINYQVFESDRFKELEGDLKKMLAERIADAGAVLEGKKV
jgi:hypothetical protein